MILKAPAYLFECSQLLVRHLVLLCGLRWAVTQAGPPGKWPGNDTAEAGSEALAQEGENTSQINTSTKVFQVFRMKCFK